MLQRAPCSLAPALPRSWLHAPGSLAPGCMLLKDTCRTLAAPCAHCSLRSLLPALAAPYARCSLRSLLRLIRRSEPSRVEQLDAACGPRAFTFFLYLSDVEEGGGTKFPYLNVTVKPKRGSAVLWPHGTCHLPMPRVASLCHVSPPYATWRLPVPRGTTSKRHVLVTCLPCTPACRARLLAVHACRLLAMLLHALISSR